MSCNSVLKYLSLLDAGGTEDTEVLSNKNFNEEATFNIIANRYYNHSSLVSSQFNPIEKIIELCEEKIALYDACLKKKMC